MSIVYFTRDWCAFSRTREIATQIANGRAQWVQLWRSPAPALGLATLCFAVVQLLRVSRPDPEAAFHVSVAQAYLSSGWMSEFPWMHGTWLAHQFVDPYWLTHWLTIPVLVVLPDPVQALKLIEVLAATATVYCLAITLKRFGVASAYGWALGSLALTPTAAIRIAAYRGTTLFTILWILFLVEVVRSRPKIVFGLSWIAVYLYTGFPLLPLSAVAFSLAVALSESRLEWKTTVASVLGMGAGLIVNPFFPGHFRFYRDDFVDSILQDGLIPGVTISSEWVSLAGFDLVKLAAIPLLLTTFTGLIVGARGRKLSLEALFGWILSAILLLFTARSIKFLDYAQLAVWLAFALSWPAIRAELRWGKLALVGVVGVIGAMNLRAAHGHLLALQKGQPAISEFQTLGDFLRQNTSNHEPVVAPWEDFPLLFMTNPHNTYPVGLNPNYLRRTDEKRFAAYAYLYAGAFQDPNVAIAQFFDARMLVTRRNPRNRGEQQLLASLADYPSMRKAYENDSFLVYRNATAEK